MLVNNQGPISSHRHNYVRLTFLVTALVFFIGYIIVQQFFVPELQRNSTNASRPEHRLVISDIAPSEWTIRSLDAINYFWQLAWLLYSLTFVYRRTSAGYLYLSPNTLTPTFYLVYILSFVLPTVWILVFQKTNFIWTWTIYFISFLLLSFALLIINNNLYVNKKIYETEGFNRDIWCLRFFAQNGVAFFACSTAIHFILSLDIYLQIRMGLLPINAGTLLLVLAGAIAFFYFFAANFNAALVERCQYQFAPWLLFILFFWGVIENNWIPKQIRRNSVIAAIELIATLVAAVVALLLFTMRYRLSKIDPLT